MNEFLQRLKQRKLVQWAVAHVAAAFALLQGVDIVAQRFGWPDAIERFLIIGSCIGFFVLLVFAWYHGERGAQRVNGIELLILALLLSLGGAFLWRFSAGTAPPPKLTLAAPAPAAPRLTLIPDKSIAVLPFENLSDDKSNAYFASGMQDLILTKLSDIGDLKVISRTSTERYASHPGDLKTIAQQLAVATLLEGSVQKAGASVLINVQLIDARTDHHLWAQSYQRTLDNIFGVEGEVAQKIATALKATLSPAETVRIADKPTQNAAAYDLFLKGEYAFDQAWKNPGDYQQTLAPAITYFQDAVAADPQFALAFAELAETQLTLFHFGLIDGGATRMPEVLAQAKENIDRALRLEPDLAAAHAALGRWHLWGGSDYDAGLTEFKRALAIDPRISYAAVGMAGIFIRQGRPEQAIEELSKALEFDPRNFLVLRALSGASSMRRDYARAVEIASRAVALDPGDEIDAVNLGQVIINEKGDVRAALHLIDSLPAERRNGFIVNRERLGFLMLNRDFAGAERCLGGIPPEKWRTDWSRSQSLGEVQRALGQKEAARESFQQARTLLVSAIAKDPEEPMTHAALGSVEAALGKTDEALREAQRAVDLQPSERDALKGPDWLVNLAGVNAQLGRTDEAINLIARLLAMPNTGTAISYWYLKLDPEWDPLSHAPSFQALLAKYGGDSEQTAP